MAFGSLLCVPANIGPQFRYSKSLASANGIEIDFVPTVAAGTKFDLTSATAYTVTMDNGTNPALSAYFNQTVTNTKLSGGASGGSLSIAGADAATAISALLGSNGATNGSVSIVATDGTNSVIVGVGTWSAQYVA